MSKGGINRSISIPQADVFGRIGTGIGKGISDQLPKEMERNRLGSALENLGNQKGLTPFQQYTGLVKAAHEYPQVVQSGSDLLRQQAIIDSISSNNQSSGQAPGMNKSTQPYQEKGLEPNTATTTESTEAALNPYIPPSGPEQEAMARRLMAAEPQIYPNIDAARAAISNQISANSQQSNAKLQKRELEESVQNRSEQKLRDELATIGANIPGTILSNLQQKAVDDVVSGKLSPDKAKHKYGKEAENISNDFDNIRSWGNLSLITKDSKDLISSIKALQRNAKEGNYRKQAADALIAENGLSPQMAYAQLYPVSEIKPLNEEIKSLKNIKPIIQKSAGAPGLAGIGFSRPKNEKAPELTKQVSPRLARAMGTEGSPLSISRELDRLGYDTGVWKQYLLDNQDNLNLTKHQLDELQKPKPSYFGWLNDWWLSKFSGVK